MPYIDRLFVRQSSCLLLVSLLLVPISIADETTLYKGCNADPLESGELTLTCSHRTTADNVIITFILHRNPDRISIGVYISPRGGYWVSTMPFDSFAMQVDDHPIASHVGRWSSSSLLATYPIQERRAQILALLDAMAQGEKIAIFIADRHMRIPLTGATIAITSFRERLADY